MKSGNFPLPSRRPSSGFCRSVVFGPWAARRSSGATSGWSPRQIVTSTRWCWTANSGAICSTASARSRSSCRRSGSTRMTFPALVTYHVSPAGGTAWRQDDQFFTGISRRPEGLPLARQCPRTDQRPGAGSGRGGERMPPFPQGPSLPHPGADGPLRDRRQSNRAQS